MGTLPIFWRKPGLFLAPGMLRYSLKFWIHEVFWILKICHWAWTDFPLLNSLINAQSLFDLTYQQITPSFLIYFLLPLPSPSPPPPRGASLASHFLKFSYAKDSFFSPFPFPSLSLAF